ncbi:ATP-binding protein [Hydrogenobacter thermophilus]|uniref:ATP-binding protein n=1 Tax=Hydrogenobacter thermophilus TaxID=940 RepID=UPI0030F853A1
MIHTEEIVLQAVKAIRQQREELQAPVHALIWGAWGVGKTFSAQRVAKQFRDVFYMKVPADDLTRSKLVKTIGLAVGPGYRQSLEATRDLLKYHLKTLKIKPVLLLDEAQRVLKRPVLVDELKDLSEDEDMQFCFVFLGDMNVPKIVAQTPHSIYKRVIIKKELQPLTEKTVEEVVRSSGLKDGQVFYAVAKERGWTTLDVAVVARVVSKLSKDEITAEDIKKVAVSLGR